MDPHRRAPFYHTSSSADLTSPDLLGHHRAGPSHAPRHAVNLSPVDTLQTGHYPQSSPISLDNSYSFSNPPRSRSPSPNPFKAPKFEYPSLSTIRFVGLCTLWYACSALSSNTGKVILNDFRFPVTLTIVQFFFVAGFCVVCSRPELGWTGRLRSPTLAILKGTLPMAAFQVGGHIFGSLAISRVPVSTVHTIKALSPLFTVIAYAALFGVSYSPATYLSLLPLTLGVMLACSFDITVSNILGLVCAFGSTLIFVSQNIFFKKIMPTNSESASGLAGAPKLDKINLLYFSSGTAFMLMIPVWLYSDASRLIFRFLQPSAAGSRSASSIAIYFFLNGVVHFSQSLLAFAILSSTSPVTYSIASLVKRIAVICLAIVWFNQAVHPIQAVGIILTAVGLWMYNNAKRDVEKGEKKMRQVEAVREGMLPINRAEVKVLDGLADSGEEGYLKPHSSPRPRYPHNAPLTSASSAVRSSANPLPPTRKGLAPTSTHYGVPYPSPPASAGSISPPTNTSAIPEVAVPLSATSARHRRMSIDGKEKSSFRIPQPQTSIIPENGVAVTT